MGLGKKVADAIERVVLGPRSGQDGPDLDDELRDLTDDTDGQEGNR